MEMESVSEAEALVAKFPNSSKAWVDGALSYLHYGGINKARVFTEGHQNDKFKEIGCKGRSLLERSLQCVPPKEHPDMLKTFENLEQKYGA
ncbi:hypothetical protein AVEN_200621-1 [Araneus ventricosus]|uniref:Uncharacterized protein n=1 Tax=Araneus ventricosus TaxID=182803 RepID=A0A4Y2SKY0_ARAVE|nr:hypothetical protein AVEN_200621-1 [Araneus ventricosus]